MNSTLIWLVIGLSFCLMEFFLPTAFTEFSMGMSALLIVPISIILPYFGVQIVIWMGLSVGLMVIIRKFLIQRKVTGVEGAQLGKTLTTISKGDIGRVKYEGNSWRGRCHDNELEIPANQSVYIIGREGNTLIVIPEKLLIE
ncbi:MAG: NfeD family protein [Cyanobacteria bacterium WB6_1B_304]|jgi:membrane protein implicated in regulation of membrane protease activity|nr:NfeD family protein [Cyanobacteria bacterium WB6_1B_304]